MKLYLKRKDGFIHVMQQVHHRVESGRRYLRTLKTVEDTPQNYDDIKRWAEVVGHDLEEI